ncbi:MAG: hypothetical protein J5825_03095 [Lachnospiraceae bacterium]|nr:hypothetical protein [Lachnospiraceae bacterium]
MNAKFQKATGLLAAIAFGLGYISPIYPAALFVAALIAGFDAKAKKAAGDAFLLAFIIYILTHVLDKIFSLLLFVINLIPVDFMSTVASFVRSTDNVIGQIISLIFFVIMIAFALLALTGKIIRVPVLSGLTDKFTDNGEE